MDYLSWAVNSQVQCARTRSYRHWPWFLRTVGETTWVPQNTQQQLTAFYWGCLETLSYHAACANEHHKWGLNQTRPSLPVVSNCSPLSIVAGFDIFCKKPKIRFKITFQKGAMKQLPYWTPTNFKHNFIKLVASVTGQLAIVNPCPLIWHKDKSVSEETSAKFFWVEKSHRLFVIRDNSENLHKINIFL
jgi:hypothetical protein